MPHDSPVDEPSFATPKPDPEANKDLVTAPRPVKEKRAEDEEFRLPVTIANRYQLIELRGGGGMAKVYRATDVRLPREVAVKLMNPKLRSDPQFDTRFQREACLLSQLYLPHIVTVLDFGIDERCGPYLVMEYLVGHTLREVLTRKGPVSLRNTIFLSAQLLLALMYAHKKGIVHRDIKPDNLFIVNRSGVQLHLSVLDFGIARICRGDEEDRSPPLTEPGIVIGTPRYMSPEQLAGNPAGCRSDLFSAAVVIHETLTGRLPFVDGKSLTDLCPSAPPALQALLQECLSPNPNVRPPGATDVYLRLRDLSKAIGVLLLPPWQEPAELATNVREPIDEIRTEAYVAPRLERLLWWLRTLGVSLAIALAAAFAVGVILWALLRHE